MYIIIGLLANIGNLWHTCGLDIMLYMLLPPYFYIYIVFAVI